MSTLQTDTRDRLRVYFTGTCDGSETLARGAGFDATVKDYEAVIRMNKWISENRKKS